MEKGKTFIISGPSGVGKGTIVNALMRQRKELYLSISATTREARQGEVDGVHYHFIGVPQFQQMIKEDAFLEYAQYVGNYYGTPMRYVDEAMEQGRDVILEIDVQGANQVRKKRPEATSIFVIPPSWEELENRLRARGTDSEDTIRRRLLRAREELASAPSYHYIVINDTVENTLQEIQAIMLAEHCKSSGRLGILKESDRSIE